MTESGELDIMPAVKDSLAEFFARILSMEVDLSEAAPSLLIEGSGFRGHIGISGEKQGNADILVGDDYAILMAASMLSASVEEVEIDHEVPDLLLEMADFISRNLSQCLKDAGFVCQVTEPQVRVEENLESLPRPGGKRVRIAFKHQDHIGLLEIGLEDADHAPIVHENEKQATDEPSDKVVVAPEVKSDGQKNNETAADAPAGDGAKSDANPEKMPDSDGTKLPDMPAESAGDDVPSVDLELEPLPDDDLREVPETAALADEDDSEDTPGVAPPADDRTTSAHLEMEPLAEAVLDEVAPDGQTPPADGETPSIDRETQLLAVEQNDDAAEDQAAGSFEGLSAEDLADLTAASANDSEPPPSDDETLPPEKGAAADEPAGQGPDREEGSRKDTDSSSSSQKVPEAGKARRRAAVLACTLLLLITVAAGAFYFLWPLYRAKHAPQSTKTAVHVVPTVVRSRPAAPKKTASATVKSGPPTPEAVLKHRIEDAQRLRQKILAKQDDILSLVEYFENAIDRQRDRIRRQLQKDHIRTFQQAADSEELALALRTIQRQSVSAEALRAPLEWLGSASETLDYGIRKTRIDFQMAPYTRGADLQHLAQFIAKLIRKYTIRDDRLLTNVRQAAAVPVKAIWKDIAAGIEKAVWVQGSDAPTGETHPDLGQWLVNRKIWRQLCHGNYHRKSELTMISAQAAACLSGDAVQDLFLDNLEELPAAAAYHLARWTGHWLVLNGLTTLSAAAAEQLAKWKGQRLSINGLKTLSPQAARFLSHWPGRQLELASLSIDRRDDAKHVLNALKYWAHSGGKLFVSKMLQLKITAADR